MKALEKLDDLLEGFVRMEHGPAGCALKAVRGQEIIYEGYKGYADEKVGKLIGPGTVYRMYSCTKVVTAAAAMLLLERGYEVPGTGEKKAYLIEKNMPADKLLTILKQAEEERRNGTQVTISIMKKNKKFQKEQMMTEGYTEFVEFFRDKL